MTVTLLPETDRIASDVNPLLEGFADLNFESASFVEIGALTVIGFLKESVADLLTKTIAEGESVGVPAKEVTEQFGVIFDSLSDLLQPRLNVMRDILNDAKVRGAFDAIFSQIVADEG